MAPVAENFSIGKAHTAFMAKLYRWECVYVMYVFVWNVCQLYVDFQMLNCVCVYVCFRCKKSSHLSKPTVRVQFTLCLKDTTLCPCLCLCVYVYVLTASGLKFAL